MVNISTTQNKQHTEKKAQDNKATQSSDALDSNIMNGVRSRKQAQNELHGNYEIEKRRKLSSPRPRKSKNPTIESVIDEGLQEIWASLPKNIDFLSTFFDDSVTSHYYRGEFKETRKDLIKRLLDPELSLEEVSRLLGVCPATIRRYTNRSWLEHVRTKGGQRRFRLSGVVRFVETHGKSPR